MRTAETPPGERLQHSSVRVRIHGLHVVSAGVGTQAWGSDPLDLGLTWNHHVIAEILGKLPEALRAC